MNTNDRNARINSAAASRKAANDAVETKQRGVAQQRTRNDEIQRQAQVSVDLRRRQYDKLVQARAVEFARWARKHHVPTDRSGAWHIAVKFSSHICGTISSWPRPDDASTIGKPIHANTVFYVSRFGKIRAFCAGKNGTDALSKNCKNLDSIYDSLRIEDFDLRIVKAIVDGGNSFSWP